MHTEDEAKERWCPFVRTVERWEDGVTGARNRVAHPSDNRGVLSSDLIGCNCIASQCMAWRWYDFSKDETGRNELPLTGYCGLAGKP